MITYGVRLDVALAVVGLWLVTELVLRLRRGNGPASSDWSLPFIWVMQVIGVNVAFRLAHWGHGALGGGAVPVIIGIVIALGGLALRAWAIVTLGRFFRYVVVIQKDHRVVDQGPYRVLRHPSYTGILLILLGIGLILATWPAIAAIMVIPLPGMVARIVVEERALISALGDEYRAYSARTRRIIPRVL